MCMRQAQRFAEDVAHVDTHPRVQYLGACHRMPVPLRLAVVKGGEWRDGSVGKRLAGARWRGASLQGTLNGLMLLC